MGPTDQRGPITDKERHESSKLGNRWLGLAGLVMGTGGMAHAGVRNSEIAGQEPDFVNGAVSPNPLADAKVTVSVGEPGRGNMQITLDVAGVDLPAGTKLGAHVHVNPCGTFRRDLDQR